MTDLQTTPKTRAAKAMRGVPLALSEAHQTTAGEGKADKPQFLALLHEALTQPGRVAECYHLFHRYSFGNALWIAEQLEARGEPLAPIASFNRWRELGRRVKKGSSDNENFWTCAHRARGLGCAVRLWAIGRVAAACARKRAMTLASRRTR